MRKVCLVCPNCGISNKGWRELASDVYCRNIHLENNHIYRDHGDNYNSYCICVEHECGYITFAWKVVDFIVEIEDGIIVRMGGYWKYHFNDLKKFLKDSNNLKI